ncbi:hypothetical protein AVEN_230061-1 [Araneus ventricosus]|uniref:RNase H type-1 domain-containing protein n=1 Tax=Araneus ventricosus TaxID=182803 RepID=A0A4Y2UU08_ARAVE|nr:hypothetical protein AVEN_230061-1 [Araneus ventricosus]
MECHVDENDHLGHHLLFALNRGVRIAAATREIGAVFGEGAMNASKYRHNGSECKPIDIRLEIEFGLRESRDTKGCHNFSTEGNECADRLGKEAITKGDPFLLPKPLSYLKYEIKSAALNIWQDNWDKGETGRSTHDIVPRVSNKPIGWKREEIMFATGHGPFPSSLQSSNT